MRWPVVLVAGALFGLAVVAGWEWLGGFATGFVLLGIVATWFEFRLSHVLEEVTNLEATVGTALERLKAAQGRCGQLPPLAFPGQPGTASCKLAHGHASDWHQADDQHGLPGVEWKDRGQ